MNKFQRIKYKIKDIGKDFGDAPFGSALKTKDYTETGIPMIQGGNIVNQKFKWNHKLYVSKEKFDSLKRSHCRKGDLIFPKIGNRTVGSCAIAKEIDGNDVFLLSTNMMKMSVDTNKADLKYVYYYFCQPKIREYIASIAGGGAQPIFNFSTLKEFEIILPNSVSYQTKVSTILSKYDDLIDNNSRRIQLLESMAKLIYDEWFVKFKFPGHEKVKMVDSKLGEIPEGWEIKKLSDVIEFKKGKQAKNLLEKPNSEAVPYLLIDGIKTGFHVYTDEKGVYASRRDILMVMDGASSGMVYSGQEGYVGSTLALIDIKDKSVSPEYIMLFLISNFNQISSNNTGAAIPHANKEFMYQMDIVLSKKEMREPLFSFFENLFAMKTTLELKNINLRKTRDLLLPKLMSGKLDVSELDIKVPKVKV